MKGNSKKILVRIINIFLVVILLSFDVIQCLKPLDVYAAESVSEVRYIRFTKDIYDKENDSSDEVYYMLEVKNDGSGWYVSAIVNNVCGDIPEDASSGLGSGLFYTLYRAYLESVVASLDGDYGWIDGLQEAFKSADVDFDYIANAMTVLMEYAMYNEAKDTRIINVLMKEDTNFFEDVLGYIKNNPVEAAGLLGLAVTTGPAGIASAFLTVNANTNSVINNTAALNPGENPFSEEAIILARSETDGKINILWGSNDDRSYKDIIRDSGEVESTTMNPFGTSLKDKDDGFFGSIFNTIVSNKYTIIRNANWTQIEKINNLEKQRESFLKYYSDTVLAKTLINVSENQDLRNKIGDIDMLEGFEILTYDQAITDVGGAAYRNDGTMTIFTNGYWSRVEQGADKKIKLKIYKKNNETGNNELIKEFKIGGSNDTTYTDELYINEITSVMDFCSRDGKKVLVPNIKGTNPYLMYRSLNGNTEETIDTYNDLVAILNTSSRSIDVYQKVNVTDYVQIGSVSRDKVNLGANQKREVIQTETSKYYLYPEGTSLKIATKTEAGVESESLSVEVSKPRKIYAKEDPDGDNYIYFLYSNITPSDKSEYFAYYYIDPLDSIKLTRTGADYDTPDQELQGIFFNDLMDTARNVKLRIGKYANEGYYGYGKTQGAEFKEELADNQLSNYIDPNYNKFSAIPISAVAKLVDGVNDSITYYASISSEIMLQFSYKEQEKEAFKNWIFDVMKPIIMFLIFIALLITAIYAIWGNQIAEERAKIAQRFNHIITGTIIFLSSGIIFSIVLKFTERSFTEIEKISTDFSGPTYDVSASSSFGGIIIWIISEVLDFFTWVADWLIGWVQRSSGGGDANLIKLIFDTYEEGTDNISTIMPFTQAEWANYMIGYRGLIGLAMAILSIAIIRIAYGLVLHAGNAEKIAEEKNTMSRIMVALIGIVLAPYGIRLLLTLFNYIVAMIPVDPNSGTFELEFDNMGIVGSIANAMFIWVKLKIYILFLVRKVMITVMLIATPFVLSVWAVSGKFRSASLWLGELVSNIATQVCYALVFFVAVLITYEGQNAFVTLLIVMSIPKIANFFRDSLQGYVQRWGGIDEEGVAGDITNKVQAYGKKAKAKVNRLGGNMQKASSYFDKDGVSTGGRVLHNAGSLLTGKPFDMKSRLDQKKARKKLAMDTSSEKNKYLAAKSNELDAAKNMDPDFARKANEVLAGKEDMARYEGDKRFDVLRDYLKAKDDADAAERRKKEAMAEEKDYKNYGKKDPKTGTRSKGGPDSNILDRIPSAKRGAEKYEDRVVDDLVDKYYGEKESPKSNTPQETEGVNTNTDNGSQYFDHNPAYGESDTPIKQDNDSKPGEAPEDVQAGTGGGSSNGSQRKETNESSNSPEKDTTKNVQKEERKETPKANKQTEKDTHSKVVQQEYQKLKEVDKSDTTSQESKKAIVNALRKAMIENILVSGEINLNIIKDVNKDKK